MRPFFFYLLVKSADKKNHFSNPRPHHKGTKALLKEHVCAHTHTCTQRVHSLILDLVRSLCFLMCLKMQSLNFCSGCLLPASPAVMDSLFGTLRQSKLFHYLLLDIIFYYRNITQPSHSFILNFTCFSFLKKNNREATPLKKTDTPFPIKCQRSSV